MFGFYRLWWYHCGGLREFFFLVRLNGDWLGIWWCRHVVMWDSWRFWVFGSTDFVCWWCNRERES